MKKTATIILPILIAIAIIFAIQPFYNQYQESKKYAFKLNTQDGVITKDSFQNQVLAVYFGYTYCPDVCPTSLSTLADALNSFSEEKQKNFRAIFVSVDPNRDKLEDLKSYAGYFHKNFIGATTNQKDIDNMAKRYESFYKKISLENSAMDYSIAHTAYIYFFDKDGRFVKKVDHFSNPDDLKKVLHLLL